MKFCRGLGFVLGAGFALCGHAQEYVFKLHHPLPPTSTAQQKVLQPWCDKVASESNRRIKCQIYPAMQLGGSAPQLYDQLRDGVVDLIWTIPGYAAGRFPISEVFELPFMTSNAETTSKAIWDFIRLYNNTEFKDVKPLAFHAHGGGIFHMVKKPIRTMADLRGQKVRAPTRQTTKLLAALGAVPVGMPVPQVPEALSKGVLDGALLPYEVMPAIKANELTKFHSEPEPSEARIYNSVFIFAMNKAKYDALPVDLKKIIDANSGIELSAQIGRIFDLAESGNRKLVPAASVNVIVKSETQRWRKSAQAVIDGWVSEVTKKGADGKALLAHARALQVQHAAK